MVPGAVVTAHRTFSLKQFTSPVSAAVVAGPDGRYRFSSLDPGAYVVCVEVSGTSLLNPCLWALEHPRTILAAGMTMPVNIQLKTGAKLHIRLDDPQSVISSKAAKVSGPLYLAGVWTAAGTFQPAQLIAKDASGHDLEMNVPTGKDLKFLLHPGELKFEDELGNNVDSHAGNQTVRVNDNENVHTLKFKAKP